MRFHVNHEHEFDLTKMDALGIRKVPFEIRQIPIDLLYPGMWQQRKTFDDASLNELAASMLASGGNTTAIVVVPRPDGGFSIISGERRWRAAQRIQLETLEAKVGKYNYDQAGFIACAENVQREDLNPIEEASTYLEMKRIANLKDEDIAKAVNKSRPHVTNLMRLLSLDIQVRDALIRRKLTTTQARPLCVLERASQQRELCAKAIRLGWSVKRITAEVEKLTNKPATKVKATDFGADIRRLEQAISESTGHPCVVQKTEKGNWKLGIIASGDEQFMGLLEMLGVETDMDLEK
jgi:ParB family chromosome partitioning protein